MTDSAQREHRKPPPAAVPTPDPAPLRKPKPKAGASASAKDPVDTANTNAPSHRFAHAPVFDLGDAVVGDRSTQEALVYALDTSGQGPRVEAAVSGDPAFSLTRAPLFLPGVGGNFDPSYAFQLGFHPTRDGVFDGTLTVRVLDATNDTVRVPLRAGAHFPGGKTRAEQAADAAASQQQQAEEAAAHAERQKAERATEAEWKRAEPYHAGALARLESKTRMVEIATNNLNRAQSDGLTVASTEIGNFVRKQPEREQPSLLEQLAWTALDLATASIAGAVAAKLKPAVAGLLTKRTRAQGPLHTHTTGVRIPPTADVPPSDAMVALVTEGIKYAVKEGGKALKGELAPRASRHTAGSEDLKAAFIGTQLAGLRATSSARLALTTVKAHDATLPLLRTDPDLAVDSMNALYVSLDKAAETADKPQAEASVRQWVRYVCETSNAAANRPFGPDNPLDEIDGLIDVGFDADHRPEAGIQPTAARLVGVRKGVVARIAKTRMIDLGLTVRASSNLRSPSSSITIVREHDGNVQFTDNTSVPQAGAWFERRAKAKGWGRDAPRAAKALIEQEIMSKSLVELFGERDKVPNVENDSAE